MPLEGIRKKRPVKIMRENRLPKICNRKSYQFVKQQKPITFSLELKLTARFSLIFFFLFISWKSKIVIS